MTENKNSKKIHSMAMPDNSGTVDDYREKIYSSPQKLKLDENSYRPAKTRQQLYNELKLEEEVLDQDIYQYAPFFQRGMALTLDVLFILLLYKIVIFITAFEVDLAHSFLDSYKLVFIFGDEILFRMIMGLTAICTAFVGVVIPMAFFNNSFGKKILNLKVRGEEKYSLSINEVIAREFIAKPISLACVAGFILPFCNKERKSLHDKIMKTIVIKD